MKAILVNDDQTLRWADVPDPVPGEDEILVKIEAAGVNRADLMQREGNYPPPPGCPEWMGLEIAGTVAQISPGAAAKSHWQVGDRVCALLGGGGYAQYVSVRYDMLMPVPKNCTLVQAAAMPEAFATAYLNLFYEGNLQPGNTLLVTAGASGLASVIIPMAKAFGARVITTVRKEAQIAAISHLGADRVVNTACESLEEALKQELDAGHGVDVAIDCLGGEDLGKYLHCLNHGARWILIAALSGTATQIDLKNIYVRNVRLIGSTLRSRSPQMKAQILSQLVQKVWPQVEAGKILPTIHAVLPIQEAEAAQAILYRGGHTGKVVLTVSLS